MEHRLTRYQFWLIFCTVCVAMIAARYASALARLDWQQMVSLTLTLVPAMAFAIGYGQLSFAHGKREGAAETSAAAEKPRVAEEEAHARRRPSRAAYALADAMPASENEPPNTSQINTTVTERVEQEVRVALEGRLGQLAHATQARFWNTARGFDPSDRETFTAQKIIIEWLLQQATPAAPISKAEAEAVEKVACPIKR